ncbi:hypothetical protein V1505DRAFT_58059 [Lipomyces doorenjongii]
MINNGFFNENKDGRALRVLAIITTISIVCLVTVSYLVSTQQEIEHLKSLVYSLNFGHIAYKLAKRSFAVFAWGAGVVFFTYAATSFGAIATATCTSEVWIALFRPGALAANTIACAAAAGASATSSAITAGLLAVGAEHGWQWYKGSGTVNRMANGQLV